MTRTSSRQTVITHLTSTWADLRGRLAGRRDPRRRSLEADLASFTTRAEVDDLLAAMADMDSPEADEIRSILTANVADRRSLFAA